MKAKIKLNISDHRYDTLVDQTGLAVDIPMSDQLKELKSALARPVEMVEEMGEGSRLTCCDLGEHSGFFAGLETLKGKFYIRQGYNDLLTEMNRLWADRARNRIVLLGNSGTGKSWYQIFVLRQLLRRDNNPNEFQYVIRQVAAQVYLIDLNECQAYLWYPRQMPFPMSHIIDRMKFTLYLYEPGLLHEILPMNLGALPSLATLSPYVERIKEYSKSLRYEELYFWPWSFSEMNAVAQDSNLGLSEEDVLKRHAHFGGIVRHVLKRNFDKTMSELDAQIASISLPALLNKHHDIDRDATGNNVSGYILCYDGVEGGQNVFDAKVLEYTSAVVKNKVDNLINTLPLKEKANTILRRLNDEIVDLSGKNLVAVGTKLLSRGSNVTWLCKRIGTSGTWSRFPTTMREVTRLWDVGERLRQPDQLLVSINTNFPLAAIVLSQPSQDEVHCVIQFTWQKSHPFTVRALYDLRVRRLRVADTVAVNVYVVSPEKEGHYTAMNKDSFLTGSLAVFKWSKNSAAKPQAELETMWANTHIYVLKPKLAWKALLEQVLREL